MIINQETNLVEVKEEEEDNHMIVKEEDQVEEENQNQLKKHIQKILILNHHLQNLIRLNLQQS